MYLKLHSEALPSGWDKVLSCSLPNFSLPKPSTASAPSPPLVRCLALPAAPRPPVCRNILAPLEEECYDVRVCLVPGGLTFLVQSYMETEAYVELQREMNVFYGDQSNWRSVVNTELNYQALVAVPQEGRWERARGLRRVGAPMFPVSLRLVDTGRLGVRPQVKDSSHSGTSLAGCRSRLRGPG